MSNGKRVDCLLKFGSTNENIGIDSKFSWENYEKYKQETDENNNEVFVFNGWMFSSSPSITPFDHPVYDVWLIKCY